MFTMIRYLYQIIIRTIWIKPSSRYRSIKNFAIKLQLLRKNWVFPLSRKRSGFFLPNWLREIYLWPLVKNLFNYVPGRSEDTTNWLRALNQVRKKRTLQLTVKIYWINFMEVKIRYTKRFLKNFRRRISPDKDLSAQFKNRIELFCQNHNHPLLRNHPLIGSKKSLRAFSVSGDIRIVYRIEITGEITLLDIGTHNQIY